MTLGSNFRALGVLIVSTGMLAQTAPKPPDAAAVARMEKALQDWANLNRYRADNALVPAIPTSDRVIFMGDSITDAWGRTRGRQNFFSGKGYINRGISGQ